MLDPHAPVGPPQTSQPASGGVTLFSYPASNGEPAGTVQAYLIHGAVGFWSRIWGGAISQRLAADPPVLGGLTQPFGNEGGGSHSGGGPRLRARRRGAGGAAGGRQAAGLRRHGARRGWPGSSLRLWHARVPLNLQQTGQRRARGHGDRLRRRRPRPRPGQARPDVLTQDPGISSAQPSAGTGVSLAWRICAPAWTPATTRPRASAGSSGPGTRRWSAWPTCSGPTTPRTSPRRRSPGCSSSMTGCGTRTPPLAYVRAIVCNLTRNRHRHLRVARLRTPAARDEDSSEQAAIRREPGRTST